NLQNFDAALVVYTFGVLFATWGVAYHYCVWTSKPPTRLYWQKGRQLFRQLGWWRSSVWAARACWDHLIAQKFIWYRSRFRWGMPQLIFWGCVLSVLITFPLVFGWVHFRSAPGDQNAYVTYVFGFPTMGFPLGGIVAWTVFHGLDIAAVLV